MGLGGDHEGIEAHGEAAPLLLQLGEPLAQGILAGQAQLVHPEQLRVNLVIGLDMVAGIGEEVVPLRADERVPGGAGEAGNGGPAAGILGHVLIQVSVGRQHQVGIHLGLGQTLVHILQPLGDYILVDSHDCQCSTVKFLWEGFDPAICSGLVGAVPSVPYAIPHGTSYCRIIAYNDADRKLWASI